MVMMTKSGMWMWGFLALIFWAAYFVVSAAPVGVPFLYADF